VTTEYLTLEDALAAGEAALGHPPEVRDYGLLQSALGRPRATVFGEDAYVGLDAKAAALLASLVANHTLVDGNKRLGWVCVRLFYVFNGRDLQAPEDDAFDLVMSIARGEQLDVMVIARRLAGWVR
jgi:death-on-curing protein